MPCVAGRASRRERLVRTLTFWLRPAFALRVVNRFQKIVGFDRSIALASSACLAIRQVFPPRHPQRSMSFFGGVPLAPDDLDWPMIHNRKGLLELLTFMGQVNLGALPDGPARSLLPAHGYLYFFAPMSGNFDGDASHFVVPYVEGKARKDWGPQHNPGFLEPIDGAENARYRYPWLTWHDQPDKVYPHFYPRIEIELGWLEDVAEVEEAIWMSATASHGRSPSSAATSSSSRFTARRSPVTTRSPRTASPRTGSGSRSRGFRSTAGRRRS